MSAIPEGQALLTRPPSPYRLDTAFYAITAVGLLSIGILGTLGHLPPSGVAAGFLTMGLIPELVILSRSKNSGAWTLFFLCLIPIVSPIGGACLAGRISLSVISACSLALSSVKILGITSYYTSD
ncbi:MAG: hypothetical protein S4CHLAM45_12290 [Chlamydiales bacterium]|nr:hypothetical protein [Chlamydiales bacterium]MCH9619718.1 hypothetical protein [Chlamydiales bacterium]MCH9623324.1 hypothetical protein [Chlamydiales bacterium]